jgi:hypothetical protein
LEKLFSAYKKNKGINPLFSIFYIIDWYDGVVSGLGNLIGTNDPYLINIVAWDFSSRMKIFSIINVTRSCLDGFEKAIELSDSNYIIQIMEEYIRQYSGDIFLVKSEYIDDIEYDLVKLESGSLQYYNGMEEISNQGDDEKQKWFNQFK